MNLNRRNVLAGLGAAAVGTGAAFGSGAFTNFQADRTVDIQVAEDDGGMVSLSSNTETSEYIDNSGGENNNELKLDVPDINDNVTLELGEDGAPFSILNNTDEGLSDGEGFSIEVWAEIEDGHTEDNNASEWQDALTFEVEDDDGNFEDEDLPDDGDGIIGNQADNAVTIAPEADDTNDNTEAEINVTIDTTATELDDGAGLDEITFHAEPAE